MEYAHVVFTGKTDLPWLRFLRPGFRHCFVLLNDGKQWLSIDPLAAHTDVQAYAHVPPSFDLPGWLAKRGHKIVKAPLRRGHKRPAPLMLFTCVEAVKRVIGLHKTSILTPWQLYRHLTTQPI
ncbi:MAG TPA: hypothetical protein PLO23_05085 [Alphaproteobacteria bacterium]|nr:hypothetical protein [Alphaproteobacteria bacterium]